MRSEFSFYSRRAARPSSAFSRASLLACLALFFCAGKASSQIAEDARTQQVSVPLFLDYPLLSTLIEAELFRGPGATLDLLGESQACSEVILSSPEVSAEGAELQLLTDLRASIGFGARGNCSVLVRFEGRLGVLGQPEIRGVGTVLAFTPSDVWLLDSAGERITNDALESMATQGVRQVFTSTAIDLQPQLASVSDFLPAVLPRYSRTQIEALVQTLQIEGVAIQEAGVDATISLRIEPLAVPLEPERPLTDAELAEWEERWQTMDALLVLAVKHYAAATSLRALRDALLEALIESRYRLRDALAETPDTGSDLVRDWFLDSWTRLAPVLRRIALEQPGQEQLLLVNVITATDALAALDQLGPSVGLDISTDGLRRLARMLNEGEELLDYDEAVDPTLRRLLEESSASTAVPSAWRFNVSLFPKAFAAEANRLNRWAPKRSDLPEYLPSVAQLMEASVQDTLDQRDLDPSYQGLYRDLVLTTAWQESCWRHYVVSDDRKLVPLKSGTGDVGLMQINERVWRGFYDRQRLRWDIEYNSAAGAEVLIDYLMKYALRKGEHEQPGGMVNLARASYSAYNGGPSQVARYRSAEASDYGKKVDAAFWDKYQQVVAGNELAVSTCLGGNLSGRADALASASSGAESVPTVAAEHFTLQLGAFSSKAAAQRFIVEEDLTGAEVRQHSGSSAASFLVIQGDFARRSDAESAAGSLPGLRPWIRRLGDL